MPATTAEAEIEIGRRLEWQERGSEVASVAPRMPELGSKAEKSLQCPGKQHENVGIVGGIKVGAAR